MTTFDELQEARPDLEVLLLEVLGSVLGEEAFLTDEPLPAGPVATARLAVHDEDADTLAGMEVKVGQILARLLAGRMIGVGDPEPDDLLDAVGELGNITGGNVKSLLFAHARLSLPNAQLTDAEQDEPVEAVRVRVEVFGQIAELAVMPTASAAGLYWPPSIEDEALERQR